MKPILNDGKSREKQGEAIKAKRIFDIVVSLALLAVFSPVMLAVAVSVRIGMGGPVMFRQELFNVVKGDMSLVGPRPLLMKYMPYYSRRERLRFKVRPGITGLAQVSGRNMLGWNDRLELDAQYVEGWTFGKDIRILWKTAVKVLRRQDIAIVPNSKEPDLDYERTYLRKVNA